MIITRTPLRVSFFGGGTDQDYFFKKYNGLVISAAINKYVYVVVRKHSELYNINYRLNYSKSENVNYVNVIKNKIIKACIKFTKTKGPIYISTFSDLPDKSGLGSSSAFTVGLLNALYSFQGKKINNFKLAQLAYIIETKILNNPIGKQDQYAAAVGGFNKINFYRNNKVSINKILFKKNIINLFDRMSLVWTGLRRDNTKVLKNQKKNFNKNFNYLLIIKDIASEVFLKIKSINVKEFSFFLNKSWDEKKKLSKKILTKKILEIEKKLKKNRNVSAIKLLGAGAGGFFLCLKNKNFDQKKFSYKTIDFKIDFQGTKVLLSNKS
jgi:D-glycero-alpha-D-manno-heptose-7-phosphate kinase